MILGPVAGRRQESNSATRWSQTDIAHLHRRLHGLANPLMILSWDALTPTALSPANFSLLRFGGRWVSAGFEESARDRYHPPSNRDRTSWEGHRPRLVHRPHTAKIDSFVPKPATLVDNATPILPTRAVFRDLISSPETGAAFRERDNATARDDCDFPADHPALSNDRSAVRARAVLAALRCLPTQRPTNPTSLQ